MKPGFTATTYAYNPVHAGPQNPWRSGVFRRLPWLGLGALLVAALGVVAATIVLVKADGQPTSNWVLQPTVYLAIASAVTNIALHFALSEGITVAWWRRATLDNTEIGDLHRYWSHGNSLWAAMTSGRNMNLMAVACLLVALGPINGPLLQRAIRTSPGQFQQGTDLSVDIAPSLPDGFTGYLSGRGNEPALLSPGFITVVNSATNQTGINVTSTGCTGKCTANLPGAGFAINCSASTTPFNLTPIAPAPGQEFNTSQEAVMNGTQAFGSYIQWNYGSPGVIHLNIQYKDTQACDGQLQIRNCTLQAATVEYPVLVNGNQSTIELAPASTMFDDNVLNMTDVALRDNAGSTTLGGFYKALSDTYNSVANLRFVGAVGYELITIGATVNRYAVLNITNSDDPDDGPYNSCTLAFTDPSNDIISKVRDMIFRTAVKAANGSNTQTVRAQEMIMEPIYESHYPYLGLAILCTALGWLATVPTFRGWWNMGRTVSMSPIETAKAFGAPILAGADSNGDAGVLMKEIGDRGVRYGAVAASGSEVDRLEMSEPQYVRSPHEDQTFVG